MLFGLLVLFLVNVNCFVHSKYSVKLIVHSFKNPDQKLSNGKYCDSGFFYACEPEFLVYVGHIELKPSKTHDFIRKIEVDKLKNPLIVRLVIRDIDSNNKFELIGKFYRNIYHNFNIPGVFNNAMKREEAHYSVSVRLQVAIECVKHYYTKFCDVKCVANKNADVKCNSTGHLVCDMDCGENSRCIVVSKRAQCECNKGWKGLDCKTRTFLPSTQSTVSSVSSTHKITTTTTTTMKSTMKSTTQSTTTATKTKKSTTHPSTSTTTITSTTKRRVIPQEKSTSNSFTKVTNQKTSSRTKTGKGAFIDNESINLGIIKIDSKTLIIVSLLVLLCVCMLVLFLIIKMNMKSSRSHKFDRLPAVMYQNDNSTVLFPQTMNYNPRQNTQMTISRDNGYMTVDKCNTISQNNTLVPPLPPLPLAHSYVNGYLEDNSCVYEVPKFEDENDEDMCTVQTCIIEDIVDDDPVYMEPK